MLWIAIGVASERASAAAACAVYSTIIAPGVEARPVRQELRQAGEPLFQQDADASGDQRGGLAQSGAQRIERRAQFRRVEVAVRPCPAVLDQRVLGARVELTDKHELERIERAPGDGVDLWQHAERIRVLDQPAVPPAGRPPAE